MSESESWVSVSNGNLLAIKEVTLKTSSKATFFATVHYLKEKRHTSTYNKATKAQEEGMLAAGDVIPQKSTNNSSSIARAFASCGHNQVCGDGEGGSKWHLTLTLSLLN